MKVIKKVLPYTIVGLLPLFALAQQALTILDNIKEFVNNLVPILLIIATIVFVWGVILFLTAGADEERRANARSLMIYGLVALFVIVAVWGIVNVLIGFFDVGGEGIPTGVGGLGGI